MLYFKFISLLVINSFKQRENGLSGYVEYLYFKDHGKAVFLSVLG